MDSVDLLLHGMGISMKLSELSVLHRAMTGILTYEASMTAYLSSSGSVTIRIAGSWNLPALELD